MGLIIIITDEKLAIMFLGFIFLIIAQSSDNFQTRVVYYGFPLDSVCRNTTKNLDLININAVFNRSTMRQIKNVLGQTYCYGG